MDLATLIKLQEEAKQNKQKTQKAANDDMKAMERELLERYKRIKKGSNYQEIEEFNSHEALRSRFEHFRSRMNEEDSIDNTLERIIGGGEGAFLPVYYLTQAIAVSQTVARIVYLQGKEPRPLGTGSLVGPDLLITNNHVLPTIHAAKNYLAQFGYEDSSNDQLQPHHTFAFHPEKFFLTNRELDYTIVAVKLRAIDSNRLIGFYGHNVLGDGNTNAIIGERVNIIQHPQGQPKLIAFRENRILDIDDKYLLYETDTDKGSSGSLVLNDQWEAVALHCASVPMVVDGKQRWVANKGILINKILEDIEKKRQSLEASQKRIAQELIGSFVENRKLVGTYRIPDSGDSFSESKDQEGQKDEEIKKTLSQKLDNLLNFDIIFKSSVDTVRSAIKKQFPKAEITSLADTVDASTPKSRKTGSFLSQLLSISIQSSENIWAIAQKLEVIEGILEVDPLIPSRGAEDEFKDVDSDLIKESLSPEGSNKARIEEKFEGLHPSWHHSTVKFPEALQYVSEQKSFEGRTEIKVAQIDTGYTNHPKIWTMNKKGGYDYMKNDPVAFDDNVKTFPIKQPGHGTRTASILIGSHTPLPEDDNPGLFPYLDYVPFRVSDSVVILGNEVAERVARVVHRAILDEFDIIVMSMGGLGKAVWRLAAREAYENGLIWVCAAGNVVRAPNFVVWPAAYAGTIAAAAVDYKNKPWEWSMRGPEVDISAPGENIYVPDFDSEDKPYFNYGSGTSYAVPHIAAAAALWLHCKRDDIRARYGDERKNKWKKVEAFRQLLHRTARVPQDWNSNKMGAGILDVEALMKANLPNITDEDHVYGKKSLKQHLRAYKKEKSQLAQKELLHYIWNGDITLSSETTEEQLAILTASTKTYFSEIIDSNESLESSSSPAAFETLENLVKGWDY